MTRLAFGGFELDPSTGELWKDGDCVHMQEQPLKLLLCLLERPGQLVGREELQKRVWEGDIHVGFEDGLNAAAWRLRQVLGDSADRPLFIETVPRKGYRFVGKVVPLPGKAPPLSGSFPMPVFRSASNSSLYPALQPRRRWTSRSLWLGAGLGVGLLGAGAVLWGALRPRPVSLVITPLVNVTGDPAVDYFASALSRQVGQDLAGRPGLAVQSAEAVGTARGALPPGALALTWTLAREGQGYRVTTSLVDAQGQGRGDRTFVVSAEDLHQVHRTIAGHLADQTTGKSLSD
jgi:DNA-binding winged helix-turn-helix (wHTH) protein/TolB-like protein